MKPQAEEKKVRKFDLLKLIARVIPVLGPMPTMMSVYDAAVNKLGWNVLAAGSAALLIELLGFFSVNLAERMWTHNKGLRLDEKAQKWTAPTWKALAAAFFYLVVVEAMIALVDISPSAAGWLPVTLPFAGIIGSTVYALWSEQDERERAVREYREKKRARGTPQSDAGTADGAPTADVVPAHKKRSAGAGAPSADAVRAECVALSAKYACTESQCGWSPSVDALVVSAGAGKNARSAAASAKAGHMKNRHPKRIPIDQSLLINKDGNS